jgi:hypothetical protein
MHQHLPSQDPPKFTQIGIFWFENHLATLRRTQFRETTDVNIRQDVFNKYQLT